MNNAIGGWWDNYPIAAPAYPSNWHYEEWPHYPPVKEYPETDVVDLEDRYEVRMDLPGFTKEGIDIQLSGQVLTIKANREATFEKKVLNERTRHSVIRSVHLGHQITDEDATSYFDNGVLTVILFKRPMDKLVKKLEIQ